jgi:hypothetical protein
MRKLQNWVELPSGCAAEVLIQTPPWIYEEDEKEMNYPGARG